MMTVCLRCHSNNQWSCRHVLWTTIACGLAFAAQVGPGFAAELMAKNGMLLRGKLGYLSSVAENPLVANISAGGVDVNQIVLLDDGLRRTYLSWYQVQDGSLRESDSDNLERIRVNQTVAKGRRRVGSITSILGVSPFDKYGHRTFSIQTARGRVDIVQGITEITPLYTKLQGLAGTPAIEWDSRIATSSIPRETLSELLRNVSPSDADGRLKIVRLLFSAERYNDARIELEQAMREFPELQELQELLTQLRQYSAQRLVDEITLRKNAGQHQRVQTFLNSFPSDGVATQVMVKVSELQKEYEENASRVARIQTQLNDLIRATENKRWQGELESVQRELAEELGSNMLPRLADFQRLSDDLNMPNENKLALLISGWVVGSGAASQNLSEALSLVRSRDLVDEYLTTTTPQARASILQRLGQEEGGTPTRVAEILKLLKPPLVTEPQPNAPVGHFKLQTPGSNPVKYEVQLPDEYSPDRNYPTIITLNGAGRTPGQQIDWWAGAYSKTHKVRLGQATRHGYIVIAPHWTHPNQSRYGYSSREHGAVLASLRDAARRFAIDTDRVFLSGHSIGGDAAWDIGLSHPDLWAGVIPIVAVADYGNNSPKYISQYWENAKYVPLYLVSGELDGDKMTMNGRDIDRYMTRPKFDTTLVEYIGRGHEHFYDEIHRIFDWMRLHRRDFYRREFECVSMRESDSFFWCLEMSQLPERSVVSPLQWPPPRATRPTNISFRVYTNNKVGVKTGAKQATLWLAPEWIDLSRRVAITFNGKTRNHNLSPDIQTMLEDARTRVDRLHPFWVEVDLFARRK
ncbi:MAG: peptidase [Pirellulaceae bacterium]|nr:peptidase [Pirellulaceae bacterium]